MKRKITLGLVLLVSGYVTAQNYPHRPVNPCIHETQYEIIFSQLNESRVRLGLNQTVASSSKRSATVTPLSWPLKIADHFHDPDYWAISNFVDHGGPGVLLDYQGGNRTYDGHRGLDIFSFPFRWEKMNNNDIQVIAAASGTIILKSDGNPDLGCNSSGTGTDWNAVYVQHPDGSVAWYGHLKKNSLTGKAVGQTVSKGEYLGIVGSSGFSTDPHLHLEIYNSNSELIDPFQGPHNQLNAESWWEVQPNYQNPAICKLLTGSGPPIQNFSTCPPNSDVENDADFFSPGNTIYFSSFHRDELGGMTTAYRIFAPDGTIWNSWNRTSGFDYVASWWYNSFTLPSNAQPGVWKYEAIFNGKTYHDLFVVGNCNNSLQIIHQFELGNTEIRSNQVIISTQQILNGWTSLVSNQGIHLEPSFLVSQGAVFNAGIGNCVLN